MMTKTNKIYSTFSLVSYSFLTVDNNSGEGTVPSVSVFTTCSCILNHEQRTDISSYASLARNIYIGKTCIRSPSLPIGGSDIISRR